MWYNVVESDMSIEKEKLQWIPNGDARHIVFQCHGVVTKMEKYQKGESHSSYDYNQYENATNNQLDTGNCITVVD